MSIYDIDLDKNAANHVPLSPLGFIERTAQTYPNRVSIIDGDISFTWKETYDRCKRLGSALSKNNIGVGDTVTIMAPNVPAHFEIYYGVPMAGGVACALNTRLDAPTIAFMLDHSETKILLVDQIFHEVIKDALSQMEAKPLIIDIMNPECGDEVLGEKDYEAFLEEGDADYDWQYPEDEWQAIALNYTSGTTGDPKGVVYHHRGAYLLSIGNTLAWDMQNHPIYLWTLPMFHASGWCFHWTITALAGTHVCLRKVDAGDIFKLLDKHNITHFTAAPIVLNMMINAPDEQKVEFDRTIEIMTAGSAPPAAVLENMAKMGFNVTHVYGATEVFGPDMSCAWHEEWNELPLSEQAELKSRQGVRYISLEHMMVADHDTMEECPWDGETIGECMMRGNVIMKGYLKNPKTTKETFRGDWYHTGDLAVRHPDGYVEIKDRLKDIIISGGENISTIEVESVIYKHPAVMEAAVVARPDEEWGETPCAFIELKPDADPITEEEMIEFCRDGMAHFKAPKTIIFGPLDKTPTGKIQKYILREKAKEL